MIQVMKPSGNRRGRHHDHQRAALAGAGVVYAAAAALTRPMTRPAAIACAIPALTVLAAACALRPPRPLGAGGGTRRTAAAWLVLLVLSAMWELAAWLQQPAYNIPSHDHPTISLLLDPLTEQGPLRLVAWAAWLWAGWRLARR
jgi:hypothetical protein